MIKRIQAFWLLLAVGLAACGTSAAPPTPIPAASATTGVGAPSTPASGTPGRGKLQLIWFDFVPCHNLATLSQQFSEATIDVRCVPIGQWHDEIFTGFAAKGGADLVMLDSQFLGEAVKGQHVLDMTDWMKTNIDMSDYPPAALSATGEYPRGSGKYYGVDAQAATQMLVYRKDLFARADVQTAFQAKTGTPLAVPQTWSQLLAIARFFKESNGQYGVQAGYTTHWCGTPACYDNLATQWNQILWSWGGELWDEHTYKVAGILNSPVAADALTFDRELFQTGPDGQGNFSTTQASTALCNGSTAMLTTWFATGAVMTNPATCPQAANLAFAVVPGEKQHFISLGDLGLSVSAYSAQTALALDYVKWFESKEIQLEWVRQGGVSARKSVLASDVFKNAAPYNAVFAESYQYIKDFWNIPEYQALLATEEENLSLAINGQKGAQLTLDTMARKQQQILDAAYPAGSARP